MLLLNADYRVVWRGVKGWDVAAMLIWHKKGPHRWGPFWLSNLLLVYEFGVVVEYSE